jgi:hypothetical protein
MRRCYIAGLDVGFQQDYTALLICEVFLAPLASRYIPLLLERLPLPCTAPDVLNLVHLRLGAGTAWMPSRDTFLLDMTGCGAPILHQLQGARPAPIGIWSHSGSAVSREPDRFNVGKQDLVASAKLVVERHRLELDPEIPLIDVMLQELAAYKGWQKRTGYTVYEADWRDPAHPHDDLVMAFGMVAWWGEREARNGIGPIDLSRALEGLQMPRTHTNAPDRPRRPRWEARRYADELPPPSGFDHRAWDEAKRRGPDGLGASVPSGCKGATDAERLPLRPHVGAPSGHCPDA